MTAAVELVFDSLEIAAGGIGGMVDEISRIDLLSGDAIPLASNHTLTEGSLVRVRGWAADLGNGSLASAIVVRYGTERIEAAYGQRRPDIEEHFGTSVYRASGFSARFWLPHGGRYPLQVFAIDATAATIVELPTAIEEITVLPGTLPFQLALPRRPGSARICVDGVAVDAADEVPPDMLPDVRRGSILTIRGWAVDQTSRFVPRSLHAILDGGQLLLGSLGHARSDVAAALNNADYLGCGFTVRIDTYSLAPGKHILDLAIVAPDGNDYDISENAVSFDIIL
jgi:hypothetical protein